MSKMGGKKERRSLKDKKRSRKMRHETEEDESKSRDMKTVKDKAREHQKEQGAAGLAGAGRGGPMSSKKDKARKPDRKQKHKKEILRDASQIDGSDEASLRGAQDRQRGGRSAAYVTPSKQCRVAMQINPRLVQTFLALRKGDTIRLVAAGSKPRTLTVQDHPERFPDTGSIYVSVSSGNVRPGHRKGGLLQYSPERSVEGRVLAEELTFQATLMQPTRAIKSLEKISKGQTEQYLMAATVRLAKKKPELRPLLLPLLLASKKVIGESKPSYEEQFKMMKANPPKVVAGGGYWDVEVYSPFIRKYMDVANWKDEGKAKSDLKEWAKAHKETVRKLEALVRKGQGKAASEMSTGDFEKVHKSLGNQLHFHIEDSHISSSWQTQVTLPRDVGSGMYLQIATAQQGGSNPVAGISVWKPMRSEHDAWTVIYGAIAQTLGKLKSSVSTLGDVQVHKNANNVNLWITVDPGRMSDVQKVLSGSIRKLGTDIQSWIERTRETQQDLETSNAPSIKIPVAARARNQALRYLLELEEDPSERSAVDINDWAVNMLRSHAENMTSAELSRFVGHEVRTRLRNLPTDRKGFLAYLKVSRKGDSVFVTRGARAALFMLYATRKRLGR